MCPIITTQTAPEQKSLLIGRLGGGTDHAYFTRSELCINFARRSNHLMPSNRFPLPPRVAKSSRVCLNNMACRTPEDYSQNSFVAVPR